jgi:tetratricopeptide (TPR) repeat protein
MRIFLVSVLAVVFCCKGRPAQADMRRAANAYNSEQYESAARGFFEVLRKPASREDLVRAEYFLARSLDKEGYSMSALYFYARVFQEGPKHPFFLKATSGLLQIAERLDDETVIPSLLNRDYTEEFQRLSADDLDSVNYLVGLVSVRRGATAQGIKFLEGVTRQSPHYLKARYRLGVLAAASEDAKTDIEGSVALAYFEEVLKGLGEHAGRDPDLERAAHLARARVLYGLGAFEASRKAYAAVDPSSPDYFDALFESAWAAFQEGSFDRALGLVHGVQSPYFDHRFRPESYVLRATIYFQLCHYDRARRVLEDFFAQYEPLVAAVEPWLSKDYSEAELVQLVVQGQAGFPETIRRRVVENLRYQRLLGLVRTVDRERARVLRKLREGPLKAEVAAVLADQRAQRAQVAGSFARAELQRELAFLQDFLNQGRLVKFEIADAERRLLEDEQTLPPPKASPRLPSPRAQPREEQLWGFQGEFWRDELGSMRIAIDDRCPPSKTAE